jgi:hypothetical protein
MSAIGLNLGDHGSTCDQHLTDVSAHIRGFSKNHGEWLNALSHKDF